MALLKTRSLHQIMTIYTGLEEFIQKQCIDKFNESVIQLFDDSKD